MAEKSNFGAQLIDNKDKEQIANESYALKQDVKDILQRISTMKDMASDIIGTNALKTLETFTEESSKKIEEGIDTVETYIKQQPFKSTLISFCAGLFIAKVFGKWSSHH